MSRNNNSVKLIDIQEYKKMEEILDENIQTYYGEDLEELIERFDNLEDMFSELVNSIGKIKSYLDNINIEMLEKNNIQPIKTVSHENTFIEDKKLKISQFKKELEHHYKLIEDYGEKETKAYYYFGEKYYYDRVGKTPFHLFPKGIWYEDEKIKDIVSKSDDFKYYDNIIDMEERVLDNISNSKAPYFLKRIVGSLIEAKINEFKVEKERI